MQASVMPSALQEIHKDGPGESLFLQTEPRDEVDAGRPAKRVRSANPLNAGRKPGDPIRFTSATGATGQRDSTSSDKKRHGQKVRRLCANAIWRLQ